MPERVTVMHMCEKINSLNAKVQQAVTNVLLGANLYQPGQFYQEKFLKHAIVTRQLFQNMLVHNNFPRPLVQKV